VLAQHLGDRQLVLFVGRRAQVHQASVHLLRKDSLQVLHRLVLASAALRVEVVSMGIDNLAANLVELLLLLVLLLLGLCDLEMSVNLNR